jgi:UDP-glucose 4-epimerase
MKKILVTGARGFLGSTVGRIASEQGWAVCGLGRASQPPAGWIGHYAQRDVASCDLQEVIDELRPDAVFHGAGSASVGQSFSSPIEDFRASVLTFTGLLDAVRRSTAKPLVIFPSSAAVYGQPKSLPVAETQPCEPISPYGVHKRQGELSAESYGRHFGVTVVNCRIFSVFGPLQRRLLVWELFQQIRSTAPKIMLKGTGSETRDYLFADDLAAAMLALAEQHAGCGPGMHTYNMGRGEEVGVLKLLESMQELLGTTKVFRTADTTPGGDPTRWSASVEKLRSALPSFQPRSLRDGLQVTLREWCRNE